MKRAIVPYFFLALFWQVAATATAQPLYRASGKVTDAATGELLIGATIMVVELGRGTATGTDGTYRLDNLPQGIYQLRCSYVGYKTQTATLNLQADHVQNFSLQTLGATQRELTVTGDKTREVLQQSSQSVSTMSKSDLDKHRGQTLGETLRDLPGVTVLQTGPSISKPVVRGLHSQRVLILNAGVRQEGQQWGAEHAPEIDPFASAKIEVLKGAASVDYGSDAIGGVIRIEPRPLPRENAVGGELTVNGFGNNAQGAASVLLEGGVAPLEGLKWRLQGSYRRAGDAATPQYFLNNTGFSELNFSATTALRKDWGDLCAYYSRFSTELGVLRSAHIGNLTDLVSSMQRREPFFTDPFSFSIDFPRQRISHDLISLRARLGLGNEHTLQLTYGYQQNIRQEFDAHVPLGTDRSRREIPSFDLTLFTHTAEARFAHAPIGNFIGTLGLAATAQSNNNLGRSALIPNFTSLTGGVFWREAWVSEQWTLNAGVRYDVRVQNATPYGSSRIAQQLQRGEIQSRQLFHTVTGAVGALFQFSPEWSIGANVATAWRPPSINELYSDGVHHGTAQYETGNPALDVERSFNIDATLRHIGEKTRLEFSIYNNAISNFIYLFPLVDPQITIRGAFPAFEYQQANAVLRGIDGFFEWTVFNQTRFFMSLSLVRGWNIGRGEPLINMPSDRLIVGVHIDLPEAFGLQKTYLELTTTQVRRQDQFPMLTLPAQLPPALSDPEAYQFYVQNLTLPPAGYGLLGVSIGAEFSLLAQQATLILSAQNLLDQRFRDYLSRFRFFADDAGRNIILRLQLAFGAYSDD